MNYYERHLGDYAKDTAHLSLIEHGAYTLLLDRYYATEEGIPADQVHRLARAKSKEEKAAVDAVLSEFFALADGRWVKGRVEEEIAKAIKSIEAARINGKKGGRPKKPDGLSAETQQKPIGFSLGSENETQPKPNQKLTRHQTPDTNKRNPPTPRKRGAEPQGFQEFYAAYPKHEARAGAAKAFASAGLAAADVPMLLAAITAQTPKWANENFKYVPMPQTWLNGRRWLDEVSQTVVPIRRVVV